MLGTGPALSNICYFAAITRMGIPSEVSQYVIKYVQIQKIRIYFIGRLCLDTKNISSTLHTKKPKKVLKIKKKSLKQKEMNNFLTFFGKRVKNLCIILFMKP